MTEQETRSLIQRAAQRIETKAGTLLQLAFETIQSEIAKSMTELLMALPKEEENKKISKIEKAG